MQAVSLLGEPLIRQSPKDASALEANLAAAKALFDSDPSSEEAAIWYGRRLAYLGRYEEAIAVYSDAMAKHPKSYRLLRHRGHRYITVRKFDLAIADLTTAQRLMLAYPDAVEPDGVPGPGGPRSTDRSNIYYHLALAHYLNGDYTSAAAVFSKRRGIEPFNDDMLVSTVHWEYTSLRRLGRAHEAAAAVASISEGLDVRENESYYKLCLMYRGLRTPEEINPPEASSPPDASIMYGIAAWKLAKGDRAAAAVMMGDLIRSGNWASFGFIAAEADLARDPVLLSQSGLKPKSNNSDPKRP